MLVSRGRADVQQTAEDIVQLIVQVQRSRCRGGARYRGDCAGAEEVQRCRCRGICRAGAEV